MSWIIANFVPWMPCYVKDCQVALLLYSPTYIWTWATHLMLIRCQLWAYEVLVVPTILIFFLFCGQKSMWTWKLCYNGTDSSPWIPPSMHDLGQLCSNFLEDHSTWDKLVASLISIYFAQVWIIYFNSSLM
jgi:hypothetical protein